MFTLKQVNNTIVYTPVDKYETHNVYNEKPVYPRKSNNINREHFNSWMATHDNVVSHITNSFVQKIFEHASESCKVTLDVQKFERLMKEKIYQTSDTN
jgi:Ca2+-binding EF-hand superfamily protein